MLRRLSFIRRAAALCVLAALTAALLLPEQTPSALAFFGSLQPGMLLAGALAVGGIFFTVALAVHVLLALLAGRAFCSWLCPLGITQDLLLRGMFRKKAPRGRFAERDHRLLLIPAFFLASLLAGYASVYGLAEPYSIFTRFVTHALQPVYALLVNSLAIPAEALDIRMAHVSPRFNLQGAALALASFGAVLLLMGGRARAYCTKFCPVGTVLGFAGEHAWLRPRFTASCTGCGACERHCPAHCLDAETRRLDAFRCVACYDCLRVCRFQGMTLLPVPLAYNFARALFLKGLGQGVVRGLGAAAFLSLLPLRSTASLPPAPQEPLAPPPGGPGMPVLPPGSRSLVRLDALCTGCQTCISACPTGVLSMAGPHMWEDRTALRLPLPAMDFSKAFCQIGCTRCTRVCPGGALESLTVDEKARVQLGNAVFVQNLCVIITKGTRCGACAEHCPTGALRMLPLPPGITLPTPAGAEDLPYEPGKAVLPHIDASRCIGCGACEFACPVRPVRAVAVTALPVHGTALPPEKRDDNQDIKASEEFPF